MTIKRFNVYYLRTDIRIVLEMAEKVTYEIIKFNFDGKDWHPELSDGLAGMPDTFLDMLIGEYATVPLLARGITSVSVDPGCEFLEPFRRWLEYKDIEPETACQKAVLG